MSALTAAIAAAITTTTPVVEVSHDRILEKPRVVQAVIHPSDSDVGIDDTALQDFVRRASQRYQGVE